MATPFIRYCLVIFSLAFITACGDPLVAKIENQISFVDIQLKNLAQRLDSGQVRNANLIKQYAKQVKEIKPEHQALADELARDATPSGPLYTSLLDRFDSAKRADLFPSNQVRFDELNNLYQAASNELFNDALSDPLNVLADLSGGELPRVSSISRAASIQANDAADFGAGSQLIGNPSYGQWSTASNGMSFWEWYGMYSLFSNLTNWGSNRLYYNDWSGRRNYSYYHDYGRSRYTSPKQLSKQTQIETKAKNFGGSKFKSAYAKSRTGATGVSRSSHTAKNASKSFQSSYAKKSTSTTSSKKSSGFGNSSFRSGSSGFSRSGFGGK